MSTSKVSTLSSDSYFSFNTEQAKLTITIGKKEPVWLAQKNRAYSYLKVLNNYTTDGNNTIYIPKGMNIYMIAKTIFDRSEKKICCFSRVWDRLKRCFFVTERQKMEQIVKKMEGLAHKTKERAAETLPPLQDVRKSDQKPFEILDYTSRYSQLTNFQFEMWQNLPDVNKIEEECQRTVEKFCNLYKLVDHDYIPIDPNDILSSLNVTKNNGIKRLKDKVKEVSFDIAKYFLSKAYPQPVKNLPLFEQFRNDFPEAIQLLEESWSALNSH